MTEAATIRTVEHGEPSNLPAVRWFWRRLFVWMLTGALVALVWRISERVGDIAALREIARYSLWLVFLLVFVYVAGATATDVVQLVTALRSSRREVITTASPPATLSAVGATAAATDADQPPWAPPHG